MAMDVSVNSAPDTGSVVMEGGAAGTPVSDGRVGGGGAAARFSCGGVVPAFSVVYDVPGDRFQVLRPVAYAPGKGTVPVGGKTDYSWGDDVYCNVSKTSSGGYSATLADMADEGAFMSVLVASIPFKSSAAQGVQQYHVGALVLPVHVQQNTRVLKVVTGMDDASVSDSVVSMRYYTRRVIVPVLDDSSSELSSSSSRCVALAHVYSQKYVTDVVYDPSSHNMFYRHRTDKLLVADARVTDSSDSASVFTAVPVCGEE